MPIDESDEYSFTLDWPCPFCHESAVSVRAAIIDDPDSEKPWWQSLTDTWFTCPNCGSLPSFQEDVRVGDKESLRSEMCAEWVEWCLLIRDMPNCPKCGAAPYLQFYGGEWLFACSEGWKHAGDTDVSIRHKFLKPALEGWWKYSGEHNPATINRRFAVLSMSLWKSRDNECPTVKAD